MTSTFRLLLAAMPDIAGVCEKISDPQLRDRAFDVLVAEARMGGAEVPYDRGSGTYFTTTNQPVGGGYDPLTTSQDPSSTRIDNGVRS